MEEKLTAWKAAASATMSAVATLLGWKGVLLVVWVVCMSMDYITGTAAACKNGAWESKKARAGLWHKAGMIVVVTVAVIADLAMTAICRNLQIGFDWPCPVFPLILAWYIVTELGSILENGVAMGADVPHWLVKLIKTGAQAIEGAAEGLSEEVEDNLGKEKQAENGKLPTEQAEE